MEPRRPSPSAPPRSAADRHRDLGHAAVSVGTNLLTIVGGLIDAVFHVVTARIFGAASYGLYRWATGGLDTLIRLSPLGSDFALLRHLPSHRAAGEPHLERATLTTAFWMTLAAGASLGVGTFVLAGPITRAQGTPDAALALRWLAPSLPLSALLTVLVYATMAAKTTRYNLLVKGLGQPLLLLSIAAAAGLVVPSLAVLCASHLFAIAGATILAAWAAARVYGWPAIGDAVWPPRRLHVAMIRFSIPLGLSEFVNGLLQRADLILIGFLAGNETVGIYAGAELISRAVANVRYAFDPVASPVLAEALQLNDRARLGDTLQLMSRWTTLLTTPLFLVMLVTRRQLLGLFPASFAAGEGVLVVLMLGHLVEGCLGLSGYALVMSGRSSLALLNNTAAAALNVATCLLLVPRLGAIGAAVAAASALVLLQLVQVAEVAVLCGALPFSKGFVKALVSGLTAAALVEYLLPAGGRSLWRACESGAAVLLAYGALVLVLGLAADERAVLQQAFGWVRRQTPPHVESVS